MPWRVTDHGGEVTVEWDEFGPCREVQDALYEVRAEHPELDEVQVTEADGYISTERL